MNLLHLPNDAYTSGKVVSADPNGDGIRESYVVFENPIKGELEARLMEFDEKGNVIMGQENIYPEIRDNIYHALTPNN